MKQYAAVVLALSLLLSGCGTAAAQEAPTEAWATGESTVKTVQTAQAAKTEKPAQTGSYDLFEGETVDDSLTFRWYYEHGKKDLGRYVAEDILPQYVEDWFTDGEILDQDVRPNLGDSVSGWVLIGGTPKEDMGWNSFQRQGRTVYCRRIQVTHIPHSQNYHMEKTMAAPDLRYPESVVNPQVEVGLSIEDTGLALPRIQSAELYVQSLKQCFTLTDPQKLEILQKATTLPRELRDWTFKGALPVAGEGNVLILDLEGQGKRMVLTDLQGGGGTDLWSNHLLLMPMSIFELFGVPLEGKGYSQDDKGNTVVLCTGEKDYASSHPQWSYEFTLDPRGNLTRCLDLTEYDDPTLSKDRNTIACTYDEQDRLIRKEWGRGDYVAFTEYTYDDSGRLLREETHMGDTHEEIYTYEYDGQGRLLAKIGLDSNGEENTANTMLYWYDSQGGIHAFWFDSAGEPRGDPPETPVRRPKK